MVFTIVSSHRDYVPIKPPLIHVMSHHDSSSQEFVEVTWGIYSQTQSAAIEESCYLHELLIVHHPIARWVLYTRWLRKMTQFVSQHDSSSQEFVEVTWRIYTGWLRKIILNSLISWVNTTHLVRSSWWRVRAGKMTHLVISCTFPTGVDTTHLVVMTHAIILHNFIS